MIRIQAAGPDRNERTFDVLRPNGKESGDFWCQCNHGVGNNIATMAAYRRFYESLVEKAQAKSMTILALCGDKK